MRITVCEMPDDERAFSLEWERLARHVTRQKSDLVLLNEMPFFHWFCAAPRYDAKTWTAAVGRHQAWVRRLGELETSSVMASRPMNIGGRRMNQGFIWTPKGGVKGVHYKRYLPDEPGYYEAKWYQRGEGTFSPFEVRGWKAGFLICSDLWSMSNARSYGKKGVNLIVVPRATGEGSVEKWVAGGRVAAIVAGAYSASSNRTGPRGEAHFGGHGWVIDPNGDLLGLTSKGRPFLTVNIELSKAEEAKSTYPRDALRPD